MLEEEIDLRPYIQIFLQRWWILPLTVILGFGGAYILSTLITPDYEATAIVAIIESNDIVQFDPRFTDSLEEQPLNAFPELATSDEVLRGVLTQLDNQTVELESFRSKLDAESGLDSSVLRLRVVDISPMDAAEIANQWAETFVEWGNIVYLGQSEEQVMFYEQQLAQAEENLAGFDQKYSEFQSINQSDIISNTIAFHQLDHFNLLTRQNQINQLLDSVKTFQTQLSQRASHDLVSSADQVTILQLQSSVFVNENESVPMIIDVSIVDSLSTLMTVNELSTQLDGLIQSLEMLQIQVEAELEAKNPIILDLQNQRQDFLNEEHALLREIVIAEETARSLGFKLQEERIKAEDTSRGFRVASRASTPSNPLTGQSRILYFIGILFGGMVGFIFLGYLAWVKEKPNERKQAKE